VSSIVEAATFRIGGSSWKLLSGWWVDHGVFEDESGTFRNWSGSPMYRDPAVFEENRRHLLPLREGTGEALESLEPRFAELLARGDAASAGAVAEVKWYEATRRQTDPAQRVVLHVRAFERALPMTGRERWNHVVKRYFREGWALDRFDSDLFELADVSERRSSANTITPRSTSSSNGSSTKIPSASASHSAPSSARRLGLRRSSRASTVSRAVPCAKRTVGTPIRSRRVSASTCSRSASTCC
jgi:hypothetical protein